MENDILLLLLAAVPGIEARVPSAYFLCSNKIYLIPIAIAVNFIAVLVFMALLDRSKIPNRIESLLEIRIKKVKERMDRWFERYGSLALFLLIGLPSTGIGSFSGAFIARIFHIKGWIFYIIVFGGIFLSIAPALLIGYGINIMGIAC